MAFHLCTLEVWRETRGGGGGGVREGEEEGGVDLQPYPRISDFTDCRHGSLALMRFGCRLLPLRPFQRVFLFGSGPFGWLVCTCFLSLFFFLFRLFLLLFGLLWCFVCGWSLQCFAGVLFPVSFFFSPIWVLFCFLLSSVCAVSV